MRILALDIGTKHTGVAFFDSDVGIPLPLNTIDAEDRVLMIEAVTAIVRERGIERIVVGLPFLPSGIEGSQAAYVRSCLPDLERLCIEVLLVDERYTTDSHSPTDGDAKAACSLLNTYLKL